MNHEWINSDGERLSPWRFYAMVAWFAWPLIVLLLTGCAPAGSGVQHYKTSDFLTPVVVETKPAPKVTPPPMIEETKPLDPLAVPVPGDPRVVPPLDTTRFTQPPPQLPPPTEAQKATIRAKDSQNYQESPRRGLFRRWRGSSVSSGESAGSC
jgi:hypothetical protein